MPTYLLLSNLTDDGAKALKSDPHRVLAVHKGGENPFPRLPPPTASYRPSAASSIAPASPFPPGRTGAAVEGPMARTPESPPAGTSGRSAARRRPSATIRRAR